MYGTLQADFFAGFGRFIDGRQDFDHVDALLRDEIRFGAVGDDVIEVCKVRAVAAGDGAVLRNQIDGQSVFFGEDLDVVVDPGETGLCAAELDKAAFLFDVGCPGEFDLQRRAVVKLDEADGKISTSKMPSLFASPNLACSESALVSLSANFA